MFTNKKHKVHLIIKDHVFRFVETTQSSLQYIKSYGERYLPPGVVREGKILERETLLMILSELINDYRLQKRSIHFLVPDAFVIVRKVNIPADIPEDEITGHLFLQIGESIHLPFEDPQFDYSVIDKNEDFTEIVLVVAPRETISEYKELLEDSRLKPVAADLSSLSLYRLLENNEMISAEEHLMLVQFEIAAVNVTIFHQEIPHFTRHLKMNLDPELWEIPKNRSGNELLTWNGDIGDLDGQIDEMISEIERMMSFYRFSVNQGQAGVSKILLAGDLPDIEQIIPKFNRLTEIPVELIQDSSITTTSGESIPTRYYELVGLALKSEVRR